MTEPVDVLVETLRTVVPGWLERCVVHTATVQLGACPASLHDEARSMAASAGAEVVATVETLVRSDVDHQRGTPLTILRDAVRHPTRVLADAGVPPVARDPFAVEHFPADVYGLAPAAWADIDPALHDPGIMWGAWKAAVVLKRRRG